jgi:NADPH:quinone reductase-like Zn-dependent oxidoreductase
LPRQAPKVLVHYGCGKAEAVVAEIRNAGGRAEAVPSDLAALDELRARGAAATMATEEQDLVSEINRLTDGKDAELMFDPVGGPTFSKLVEATASGVVDSLWGA